MRSNGASHRVTAIPFAESAGKVSGGEAHLGTV